MSKYMTNIFAIAASSTPTLENDDDDGRDTARKEGGASSDSIPPSSFDEDTPRGESTEEGRMPLDRWDSDAGPGVLFYLQQRETGTIAAVVGEECFLSSASPRADYSAK